MGPKTRIDQLISSCHTEDMEDTTREIKLVHVLRHTFRPSPELANALDGFTIPGNERPRFLIKTLASLVIDSTKNYSLGLHEAKQAVERDTVTDIQLGPHLAAQRMASGALKILMRIDDTPDERGKDQNWLQYLAMINRTKAYVPDANLEKDIEAKSHTFYTLIPSTQAISQSELKNPGLALLTGLRSESRRRLYSLRLDSLSETNEERAILPDYDQPLEQAS